MFTSSVDTTKFSGSEAFRSKVTLTILLGNNSATWLEQDWGNKVGEQTAARVRTAKENSVPGVREPFSTGAARAPRPTALLSLHNVLQGITTTGLKTSSFWCENLVIHSLVNPFSTNCNSATRLISILQGSIHRPRRTAAEVVQLTEIM